MAYGTELRTDRVDVYRRLSAELALWSDTRCSEMMFGAEYIHTGGVSPPLRGYSLKKVIPSSANIESAVQGSSFLNFRPARAQIIMAKLFLGSLFL